MTIINSQLPYSLVVDKLSKTFAGTKNREVVAVDGVSLEIARGEFVTLLGPSGCGKTTVLRMIAGFESPTSGAIFIEGRKINEVPPNKRETALVFQNYALFPHMNVFENVAYGLRIKKWAPQRVRERVHTALELMRLDGLADREPGQLSGGQQQRVALARAMVMEPKLMLFDEPLSNLDAKLRVHMRDEIRKLQRQLGIASVYVTHDQVEAMSLSDRVVIMNQGRVEQIGTPREVYSRPVSKFIAGFVGNANFVDGLVVEIAGDRVGVRIFDEVLLLPPTPGLRLSQQIALMIRPEGIKIGEQGAFRGTVIRSTFMGSLVEYEVQIRDTVLFVTEPHAGNRRIWQVGEEVRVDLDRQVVHVLPSTEKTGLMEVAEIEERLAGRLASMAR